MGQIQKRKLKFAVFGFNDKKTEIIVLETQEPKCKENELTMDIIVSDWEDCMEHLPPKDVRYVVYDFAYKDISSGYNDGDLETAPIKSKVALIQWSPDSAKPRLKMLVPASVASIKQECDAAKCTSVTLQMNSQQDMQFKHACDAECDSPRGLLEAFRRTSFGIESPHKSSCLL